jgi:hypothetical protein
VKLLLLLQVKMMMLVAVALIELTDLLRRYLDNVPEPVVALPLLVLLLLQLLLLHLAVEAVVVMLVTQHVVVEVHEHQGGFAVLVRGHEPMMMLLQGFHLFHYFFLTSESVRVG